MANPMANGALLTQGIRAEFANVYQPTYESLMADIKDVIWADATSDKISELYGFWESPIYPVRWDPGVVIPSKGILSQQFRIQNRDFGRRVYLPRNQEDDQTGQSYNVARGLGRNWATLAERIFYQYIQAGTDNDLLPAVPNSADGNALYLSSTRYGSSSGNIVSQSSSWTTVQDVITDIFGVVRRFLEFQDTESQPFWSTADLAKGISIFYGPTNTLVATQAAKQMIVHSVVSSTGAGVSNTVSASGMNFKWITSQRITNGRAYFFLNGLPVERRPIVRQVRKGMQQHEGNWETSDHTRDTGEAYVQFDSREGWGSCLAIGTIRVS